MRKLFFIAVFAFLSVSTLFAQSKDELEKQRQQLRREIEATEKALSETKTTTKEQLNQYNVINKRLSLQTSVIENINSQLHYLDNDIFKSQRDVSKLTRILDTLKQEYAKSMVYAYKNRSNYDVLNFIFSASSFNDAIKRVTYLKSYRTYREMQGDNILHTQQLLHERINELSQTKQKKNQTLQEQSKAKQDLVVKQEQKARIVNQLKAKQKDLASQIAKKRKQDAKLNNKILAMVQREIAKAREAARIKEIADAKARKANAAPKENNNTSKGNDNTASTTSAPSKRSARPTKSTESVLVSSDADRALNSSFEKNKGSLPYPVSGKITIHYGPYNIPGTPIQGVNPGLTLGTQVGTPVKVIFDGEVTLVDFLEDKQNVYVKHGKYFSVYSNLESVNVSKGQTVKTGQVIGKAGANEDGDGEVQLIMMKESTSINPESWLRR